MASICQRPRDRWCSSNPLQTDMEGATTTFRPSPCTGHRQGGVPRILRPQKGQGPIGQHSAHRIDATARLSALCRAWAKNVAATIITAPATIFNDARSANNTGCNQYATYSPVYYFGVDDRRAGECDIGAYVGSRGLHQRKCRLPASGPNKDEQAARRGSDERALQGSLGKCLRRQINRACGGIWGQASGQHKEGFAKTVCQNRHSIFSSCVSPHVRGLDGASGRANAENRSIFRPHKDGGYGIRLRQIFAKLYEGCKRSRELVTYIGTCCKNWPHPKNSRKAGAAYVTRTRGPIITNKRGCRKTGLFSPKHLGVLPIWPVFVSLSFQNHVHRYILKAPPILQDEKGRQTALEVRYGT